MFVDLVFAPLERNEILVVEVFDCVKRSIFCIDFFVI